MPRVGPASPAPCVDSATVSASVTTRTLARATHARMGLQGASSTRIAARRVGEPGDERPAFAGTRSRTGTATGTVRDARMMGRMNQELGNATSRGLAIRGPRDVLRVLAVQRLRTGSRTRDVVRERARVPTSIVHIGR